jgi:hypothetical protein
MKRVAVALSALLLVGCGASAKPVDTTYMRIDFAGVNLRITTDELNKADDLPAATRQFIGLIRKYRDALGTEEVKRRLTNKADELQQWCEPCVAMLDRERESL